MYTGLKKSFIMFETYTEGEVIVFALFDLYDPALNW